MSTPSYEAVSPYLRLVSHGGGCCGVKHLYPFPASTESVMPVLPAMTGDELRLLGFTSRSFAAAMPEESALQRLERLVELIHKKLYNRAPSGVVEATLVDYQIPMWGSHLERLGFKATLRHKNSNSYNMVTMYHLCYPYTAPKAVVETSDTPTPAPKKRKTVSLLGKGL